MPVAARLAACLALAAVAAVAPAAGPSPDAIGFLADTQTGFFPADADPPIDFDGPSGKNLLWRRPLPNFSNSSPIVVASKVFVVCDHGWPLGEGDVPRLLCFDADTGELLWKRAIDPFDVLPKEQAAPLRKARHLFWVHQHAFNTCLAKARGETDEAKLAALRAEAGRHAPDFRHSHPVEKYMSDSALKQGGNSSGVQALNHPDTFPLTHTGRRPKHMVGCKWNWTGVGVTISPPVSDGETVYVLTGLKTVTAFDLDGNVRWHVYENDAYRSKWGHWEEDLAGSPLLVEGKLMVNWLGHLWAYDKTTGELLWKTETTPLYHHGTGTPQILHLPRDSGPPVTAIVTRNGYVVRARDGRTLASKLFKSTVGIRGDGVDRVFFSQGGVGGHFHPLEESAFQRPGGYAVRLRLQGDKVACEKLWQQNYKYNVGLSLLREGRLVNTNFQVFDAASGERLGSRRQRLGRAYNNIIRAGGHYYGIPIMQPSIRGHRNRGEDARILCYVARDADPIEMVGERTIELLPYEPTDPAKRAQRAALTGRYFPGEWYGWHGAYTAPFACRDRLYIRTFDYLYCFGKEE